MIDSLRLLRWSSGTPSEASASPTWTIDRNWDRYEGERLLKARQYAAAETHLARAAVEAEMRKRSASKRIRLRLMLAEAQRKQFRIDVDDPDFSKLTLAEQTVRSALEIAGRNSERDLYVQCLDVLAEIFNEQGRYEAVEKVMQEAVRIEAALAHPDPLRMARRVLQLGIAQHRLGHHGDAVPALQQAVALHEETHGADHPETANQLTELGAVYRAQGNHKEAQECLRRALRIHMNHHGVDSPAAIRDLHHLAGSLEESGDLEGAAEEYERALTYKLRVIGSDLEDLAELQYGLASLHITWQNYSRARELLMEAIGTFRRKGGIRLAVAHETMSYIDESSGRYNDAVKELAAAGKVWEQMRPHRTDELIRNLERRAELLEMLRKRGEVAYLREKIARLQENLRQGPSAASDIAPQGAA